MIRFLRRLLAQPQVVTTITVDEDPEFDSAFVRNTRTGEIMQVVKTTPGCHIFQAGLPVDYEFPTLTVRRAH